jgi:hypothetical protein
VQDPRDARVAAVVQAEAGHAQAVVPEPAPASPRRDVSQPGGGGDGTVPGGAHRQRRAQAQRAALVGLAVHGEHLGGDPVALVDGRHAAGGVGALRGDERPQPVGAREAGRLVHQRELQHLDRIVLDEHAGRLAGVVLQDLDAGRRLGVARHAGVGQRPAVGDRVHRRPVPVSPDAADVDGVVGRGDVEILPRRPALLGETTRRVLVEGGRAHGHRDDPLALRSARGLAANEHLDVGDRAAARQRGIQRLETFAIEVGVGVDEPGDDRGATQIDDPRAPVAPALDVGGAADGRDASAGHGQRRRPGTAGVERQDPAVGQDQVGGYFIHPFSRYARSAPGCRGTPTLSPCHAVRGSNSARPAWPRTSASLLSTIVFVTV